MKKHSILFCFAILIFSCSNNNTSTIAAENSNPILIAKGTLNANNSFNQENMVITNTTDWETLIALMESVNENSTDSFTTTVIDFETYMVIAVFDIKNSTTTVDITSVTENNTNVIVTIDNLQMGITQDVAHPYYIVMIEKTDKPIVFSVKC